MVSARSRRRDGKTPHTHYDPDPKTPDKSYSRIGGFVTGFKFEPIKYRIPPSVGEKMDRTQQMAITAVAEALADAGLTAEALKDKKVGIVMGNSMGGGTTDLYATRLTAPRAVACLEASFESLNLDREARNALVADFRERFLKGLPTITEDSLPGELPNVISGRIANVFNLVGCNFTVDAACALVHGRGHERNSRTATRRHRLCHFRRRGHGNAPLIVREVLQGRGALSADGEAAPLTRGANGFVMGEGVGVMVLKRLSDAVRRTATASTGPSLR